MDINSSARTRRAGRRAAVAALALAAAGLTAPPTASAGEFDPTTTINTQYWLSGFSQEQGDAIDPQLLLDGSDISDNDAFCSETTAAGPGPGDGVLQRDLDCSVNAGSTAAFTITGGGVPSEAYITRTTCYDPQSNIAAQEEGSTPLTFTPTPGLSYDCFVNMSLKPLMYIDKVIIDTGDGVGPLTVSDFEIELYDADDELVPDLEIIDPSSDQCTVAGSEEGEGEGPTIPFLKEGADSLVSSDICAVASLIPGDYTFGEVLPEYGYVAEDLFCDRETNYGGNLQANVQLPTADFGVDFSPSFQEEWVCTLSNTYVTELLTADIVIVNDDGGTAVASDFSIEVVDSSGTVVGQGPDPEPGIGNASAQFELPTGPYTLRGTGPDGYDISVSVTAPDAESAVARAVPDAGAFRLIPGRSAIGVITVNDAAPAVAVTTTTTTTTTTTVAPTTAAPTTAAPSSQPTTLLPSTGTDEQRTSTMLLLALGFLLAGGGAILATRRS